MKSVVKIALEVGEKVADILDSQSKITNWLYNHLLEIANKLRKEFYQKQDKQIGSILYSKIGLRNLVPDLKKSNVFLKTVYSSPLKNAALRLSAAIREYQKSRKGKRKGKKINWPKFRKWKQQWFSLLYDEPWKGYTVNGKNLSIQLGVDGEGKRLSVTTELAQSLDASKIQAVKQLRITKEFGSFFAIFTVEQEQQAEKPLVENAKIIALDPNHKNLAYGVATDGQAIEIANFRPMRQLEGRIDLLKSRRDRCQRKAKLIEYTREDGSVHRHWQASRRWRFFDSLLQKAYEKRRDQTKTFLYTLANRLCKDYSIIGIGDYTPHGGGITTPMRRAMNNESLIGRFKTVMAWVAVKSGKLFVEFNETGTTRTCHIPACGYRVDTGIAPDIREWRCPGCNTLHLRDENAAQNGLIRVLEKLNLPRLGHVPVAIQVRWAWHAKFSGVLALRGNEAV